MAETGRWGGRGAFGRWGGARGVDVPALSAEQAETVRLWRNTLVTWRNVDDRRQQLCRVTDHAREEASVRRDEEWVPVARDALPLSAVEEIWACRECHRVTRVPPHAETTFRVRSTSRLLHYATCSEAWWRRCRTTSTELGFEVEFCDGVDARWWRCVECKRTHSEAEVMARTPRRGHPWHSPACPWRKPNNKATRARQAEILRGQQTLFGEDFA